MVMFCNIDIVYLVHAMKRRKISLVGQKNLGQSHPSGIPTRSQEMSSFQKRELKSTQKSTNYTNQRMKFLPGTKLGV